MQNHDISIPHTPSLHRVMIGFGGNEGQPTETFARCLERLHPVLSDVCVSHFYETEPHYDKPGSRVPETKASNYINAVFTGTTALSAKAFLAHLLATETALGRKRPDAPCAPRPVDLDLLLYDDLILKEDGIVVPHPRMHLRNFVLVPACEIAPDWRHPELGLELQALLDACPDRLSIAKRDISRA